MYCGDGCKQNHAASYTSSLQKHFCTRKGTTPKSSPSICKNLLFSDCSPCYPFVEQQKYKISKGKNFMTPSLFGFVLLSHKLSTCMSMSCAAESLSFLLDPATSSSESDDNPFPRTSSRCNTFLRLFSFNSCSLFIWCSL